MTNKTKIVPIVLFSMVTLQSLYGASFDCKKASTLVEQAICDNPVLSNLDNHLAITYRKTLRNHSDKNEVRRAQRSWIKSQRNQCKDIECLQQTYILRITELNKSNDNNYTAVKFFKDIETKYITTVDDISADQKVAIISSGFLRGSEICDDKSGSHIGSWYVVERKNSLLKLGRCGTGDNVDIHVYTHKNGENTVLVVSVMGNHGEVQNFRFFSISKEDKIGKKLTFKEMNIYYMDENSFLSTSQQLPDDKNDVAYLYINDDGSIESAPMTWMQPRWEDRDVVRRIWFEWNGEKFVKQVKKIDN